MLMGNESTPYKYTESYSCGTDNKDTCYKTVVVNPWSFSVDKDNSTLMKQLLSSQGQYVILHYNQVKMQGVQYDTDYLIQDMRLVNPNIQPAACKSHTSSGRFSHGSRVGRIVKLSNKGNFKATKTWEAKIQIGNSGNQFLDMSVTDESMIQCLMSYLGGNKLARISYKESLLKNPLKQDSAYDIDAVEAVNGGGSGLQN